MSSSKQGGWTFGKSGDNQSLLTAFRADDSLVEMIPQFEWSDKISLVSSSCSSLQRSSNSNSNCCFGPFQPNVPTMVPLWLALHLQTKSLCRIIPPSWLTTDNLREILAFEKTSAQLWPPPPPSNGNGNDYDHHDDDDVNVEAYYAQQRLRLPRNYYELANRLAPVCQDDCASAVQLLVTDLLQVRLDKLRQQFQNLLAEQSSNSNTGGNGGGSLGLIVNITGIGTAEVACLRETVQQTMNDKEFLQKKTPISSSSSQSSKISKGSSSTSSTDAAAAASTTTPTTTTPVPEGGGRRLVRRFRGSVGRSNNNSKTITPGTT